MPNNYSPYIPLKFCVGMRKFHTLTDGWMQAERGLRSLSRCAVICAVFAFRGLRGIIA